jgi:hypothetical protein
MALRARMDLNRYRDEERASKPRGFGGMGQPKVKAGSKRVKGPRPGDSKSHLADVRRLPSIISGRPGPSDPHHLHAIGADNKRGMGVKNEDRWALPVTRDEHDIIEAQPDDLAYLATLGIDGKGICNALWSKRGDFDAMLRIVINDLMRRGIPYAE